MRPDQTRSDHVLEHALLKKQITAYLSTRSLSSLAKGKTDVAFFFMCLIDSDLLIVVKLYWVIIGQ